MSCETFESMIALDAGGDLPAADAERLARHLAACVDCRHFAGKMRESRRAIALLADVPVDPEILTSVRAGVLRQVERTDGKRSAVVPFRLSPRVLALAATLIIVFGALFLLRSGGSSSEAPEPQIAEAPATALPATGSEPIEATSPVAAARVAADRVAADRVDDDPIEEVSLASTKPRPTVTVSPPIRAVTTAIPTTVTPAAEPMVIKLVSEEADVVIYWLVNPPDATPKETKDEISAV